MRPFFLRRKGYVVVARCWSPGHVSGDIDLIAWQGTLLCVVEVKTRTAHDVAAAEVQVDEHKRRMVRRLACHYVRQLPQETAPEVRFDVLSVYLVPGREKESVHFEAAFGWSERADSALGGERGEARDPWTCRHAARGKRAAVPPAQFAV